MVRVQRLVCSGAVYLFVILSLLYVNIASAQPPVAGSPPVNSLQILDQWAYYGPKGGYMDNPVLVVEPHGAYAEQSLYIKYSDHGQYYYWISTLEVVHKFELPHGATVNDLWLWIGDSVMKAIVIDTWTGKHIYDSIHNIRRDPALLTKTGDQYELHIFPMQAGVVRKIKMSFIAPAQWTNNQASVELPVKFLQASAAPTKPLVVLIREKERNIWENPAITELPSQTFRSVIDTNGYHFIRTDIADISGSGPLHLSFNGYFSDGMMFSGNEAKSKPGYFQFGFIPDAIFGSLTDAAPRNVVVGLDFSGAQSDALHTVLQKIGTVLHNAVRPVDTLSVIASAPGKTEIVSTSPSMGTPHEIDSVLAQFEQSVMGRHIDSLCPRSVVLADANASSCWSFSGIDTVTSLTQRSSLVDAMDKITSVSTIAGYNYGYEDAGSTALRLAEILPRLDSFFVSGGRFVGFYDHNRDRAGDTLGHTFFPGLKAVAHTGAAVTLYRNVSGNIGKLFPAQFNHASFDVLTYTADPSISVEVADGSGNAVVISKRVHNGLMIMSSLWSFNDPEQLRKSLSIALLGIPAALPPAPRQLSELLTVLRSQQQIHPAQTAIIFSNGDSLVSVDSVRTWAGGYFHGFSVAPPSMKLFGMTDGRRRQVPFVTVGGVQYHGSEFLLRVLADSTVGIYRNGSSSSWPEVVGAFQFDSTLPITRLGVNISGDAGAANIFERRNVFLEGGDTRHARFVVGKSDAKSSLLFSISGQRAGSTVTITKSGQFLVSHDSTRTDVIIPTMMATETILDLFHRMAERQVSFPADTQQILRIAIENRLVCDYTAMLALEPNDTLHFMHNPFDESRYALGVHDDPADDIDSLTVEAFPNPFNSSTTLRVTTRTISDVGIAVYDMLGRRIADYGERSSAGGVITFRWDGVDTQGRAVATGIYFVRVTVKNVLTGKMDVRVRKLLLMK